MKKCLLLLLIGLMVLGLTLSVLAAGPGPTAVMPGRAGDVVGASHNVQRDISPVFSEPLAAKLAAVIGHDRMKANFLRRLISGVCGFLIMCTRFGFALLVTGSRARNASLSMTVNIAIWHVGMLAYQVWLFLTRFLIPTKEQREEVCYVS